MNRPNAELEGIAGLKAGGGGRSWAGGPDGMMGTGRRMGWERVNRGCRCGADRRSKF